MRTATHRTRHTYTTPRHTTRRANSHGALTKLSRQIKRMKLITLANKRPYQSLGVAAGATAICGLVLWYFLKK